MTTNTEAVRARAVERLFAVDDMTVRQDGTGRIVEAYAAIFNDPTEIHDMDGHYQEILAPTSFNKTIADRGLRFGVLFNHAMTIDGLPNPAATMPIGVPEEVVADAKGVFTATRYLDNPLADWTLDAIKNGALRAQSFSGRFVKSQRTRARSRGELDTILRQEVAMREYGPAVFAAYESAEILGTRQAEMFVRALLATPPEERVEWLSQFEGLSTLPTIASVEPEPEAPGTPSGAATTEEPLAEHSTRPIPVSSRAKAWIIANPEGELSHEAGR